MSLTFGKPDENILASPGGTDFHQFKFQSIGKEPELLKRISNREEGVRYQYSPSPEPESRYSPSPEPLPARNRAEARTRPSLLQALTSESQEPPALSTEFEYSEQPFSAVGSPQLQYPQTSSADSLFDASTFNPTVSPPPLPPTPPPPFIPDYSALKELHTRLETSHKVLATPPSSKKAPTPPPEFPRPSLISANNAHHHTEKTCKSAKEALEASQTRTAISEQGVAAAHSVVDTLTQALELARAALEIAQKTLIEARQAAEEAQSAFLASRVAADAAEETKRLLEEPPPPRAPTPEPINENAEIIDEMKKDLEMLRVWVEEQEAGHLPATAAHRREASRDRDEEEEREASNMIIEPDDNDTDNEVRDAKDTSTRTVEDPAADGEWGEVKMEIDESRRSEEDAAQALVALAEQKTTTQVRQRPPTSLPTEKGRAMSYAQAERFSPEHLPADEAALAREAALRKQQDARREQVRIQKEQAHAAAAISILRERQDAAANSKKPSPPLSNADTQSGNVVAKNTILPSAEVKVKTKKSKPVSGGVKLGPENAAKGEVPVSTDPSPALERAAALGLRVRPNSTKSGDCQSAPSSKPKKTRNSSLPPSHCDRESPSLDDVSAYRTGSDPGDVPIIQPTKAPEMPPHLSTDVQLMNLRFALQDEGITWEAISRSRPQLPGIKTEEREDDLRTPGISSSAQSIPTPLSLPRLLSANPPFATPTPSATTVTAAPIAAPLKPLPTRKQLPKFNKTTPQTETTNNGQTSKSAAADIAAQPQVLALSNDNTIVSTRPSEVPPATIPRKRSPPAAAPATAPGFASMHNSASISNNAPINIQAESRPYNSGWVSPPIQDLSGSSSNRPVSDPWRLPRYGAKIPRSRSRTPDRDRYGGRVSDSYKGGEPERYGRRTPDTYGSQNRFPTPPGLRKRSPPRAHTPPRPASPPRRAEFPSKRGFSGDHYSPGPRRPSAPAYTPRKDSPPRGPRQGIPRAPSQKRQREDAPPFHPQKRFKDDGRDVPVAASWSPEPEIDRPSLEHRLGAAPDPGVHFIGRGESYRPAPPDHDREEWAPKPEGLLSRLSDPGRGIRGRGGIRGRPNKARGRGRGEMSLADRMG